MWQKAATQKRRRRTYNDDGQPTTKRQSKYDPRRATASERAPPYPKGKRYPLPEERNENVKKLASRIASRMVIPTPRAKGSTGARPQERKSVAMISRTRIASRIVVPTPGAKAREERAPRGEVHEEKILASIASRCVLN